MSRKPPTAKTRAVEIPVSSLLVGLAGLVALLLIVVLVIPR